MCLAQVEQGLSELSDRQFPFAACVEHGESVDQVEVFLKGQVDFSYFQFFLDDGYFVEGIDELLYFVRG